MENSKPWHFLNLFQSLFQIFVLFFSHKIRQNVIGFTAASFTNPNLEKYCCSPEVRINLRCSTTHNFSSNDLAFGQWEQDDTDVAFDPASVLLRCPNERGCDLVSGNLTSEQWRKNVAPSRWDGGCMFSSEGFVLPHILSPNVHFVLSEKT